MRVPVALRYALLQLPEAAFVAVLIYLLYDHRWIGGVTAWGLIGLWVAKDTALYPLYRHALGDPPPAGAQALVGGRAETVTALDPGGYVRIRGERWRARTSDGGWIGEGAAVAVVGAERLTLIVEAVPGAGRR